MRLNPTDNLNYNGTNIEVKGQAGNIKTTLEASDQRYIKQNLGFFERIGNFFTWMFGGDFWDQKTVTIQGQSNNTQLFWVKVNLPDKATVKEDIKAPLLGKSLRTPSDASSVSTSRSYSPPPLSSPSSRGSSPAGAGASSGAQSPLSTSRSGSPVSLASTASSSRSSSPSFDRALYIANTNKYIDWIARLNQLDPAKPDYIAVKYESPTQISLEPKRGVRHEQIENTAFTRVFNILQSTFELINQNVSESNKLNFTAPNVDFDKFKTSCELAIANIKKESPSDEKTIKLGFLSAALTLATGFSLCANRVERDKKTFAPIRHVQDSIIDYMAEFYKAGR